MGRYDLMNVVQEDEGVMTQILSPNSKKESTNQIEENVNNNNNNNNNNNIRSCNTCSNVSDVIVIE